ncbi:VCBS repeat-containing protein [Flavivirga sp. 57AJ16]|uniref:FG-GAP repeat domain-containing protein n=1 Tax=Flavivirga sp. 57AJ16 TaxID=3025307 RepID=UPI002366670F|nr:VCBS repeat-containing protein [Flavivirga sp. 57AJ16]MDD7885438.1 VCBS repeat-containing protein [Flavivirga sp. 57AJ16]
MKLLNNFVYLVYIAIILSSTSCQNKEKKTERNGKVLAEQYCISCHIFPEPDELNKKIWKEKILPKMGYMLGLRGLSPEEENSFQDIPSGKIEQENSPYLAAKEPLLSMEDYQKIMDYYLDNAPAELVFKNPFENLPVTNFFEPKEIFLNVPYPSTTIASFLSPGKLIVGDFHSGQLMQLNDRFEITVRLNVKKAVLQFQEVDDSYWATVFGDFIEGTDAPTGMMIRYPKDTSKPAEIPIDNLKRPCHADFVDLDGDGQDDVVISEFGKYTGGLSWWKNENGKYTKNNILDLPGAIITEILDWDNDGDQDIVSLFAQAKEAIYLFLNDGTGKFKTLTLKQFPATYGSTHMMLADYNEDGLMDIIYSHGDNGDYNPLHKPYHGIRIFINKGNNEFDEEKFIPVPGIYNTIFMDVDNDGDKDFLTISFFPSENQPSFVYLENKGNNDYMPYRLDPGIASRWITMDHMDFDKDGDQDLVLGGFHWGDENYPKKISAVYLENTTN